MIPGFPRLHAITDEAVARRSDLDQIAATLARAGEEHLAFHARGHTLTGREHYDLASRLSVFPSACLIVNDRLDIALAVGSRGVHLPADGFPVAEARRLNPAWWVGRSVHDPREAESAASEEGGPDYLIVGPVFATESHPDRPPAGLALVRAAARTGLPVIAIGGITPDNAAPVLEAGAYGIAAIRALWLAADPPPDQQAARFIELWQ